MLRAYSAIEGVLLLLAIVVAPPEISEKFTHFTWWGITSLAGFDFIAAVSPAEATMERVYGFFASVAFTILVGVIGLSAANCTLLEEAVDEYGIPGYILGNLAIHYWPATKISLHTPKRLVRGVSQACAAASLLVLYLTVNRASTVYGCPMPEWSVVAAGGLGLALAFGLRQATLALTARAAKTMYSRSD